MDIRDHFEDGKIETEKATRRRDKTRTESACALSPNLLYHTVPQAPWAHGQAPVR